MAKYKNRNHQIEAFQLPFEDESPEEFLKWANEFDLENFTSERNGEICIKTVSGEVIGEPGDFVLYDEKQGFTVCIKEMFNLIYSPE